MANSVYGDASGILTPVGLGSEGDIPKEGLEGKLALIKRGLITFEEKVVRATDAGAIGVIVYNSLPATFRGALNNPSLIPAVSISGEEGEKLLELTSQGRVEATIQ